MALFLFHISFYCVVESGYFLGSKKNCPSKRGYFKGWPPHPNPSKCQNIHPKWQVGGSLGNTLQVGVKKSTIKWMFWMFYFAHWLKRKVLERQSSAPLRPYNRISLLWQHSPERHETAKHADNRSTFGRPWKVLEKLQIYGCNEP